MTRRTFGQTWWGKAWVDALEHRARLDPNRLPRGRTYARSGRVGELKIAAGEVRAPVHGSRVTPYLVRVRVREFSPAEWDRLLDAIAAKAGHTAALLDGELPPEVAADAAGVGVELLPVSGEIGPRCSCPDWADPCKHSAAVVYLVAEVLDRDPFALLLLRGRSRDDILASLRHRRAATRGPLLDSGAAPAPFGRPADPGVEARLVWGRTAGGAAATSPSSSSGAAPPSPGAGPRLSGAASPSSGAGPPFLGAAPPSSGAAPPSLAAERPVVLPPVPLPPRHPGSPAALVVDPPASSGLRAPDLADLAADAAERALALCAGDGDGGLSLDPDLDLVRRAAAFLNTPGRRGFEDFAARAGYRPRELGRMAQAWRVGGADAVETMGDGWPAPPEALADGRAALATLGQARTWRNRVTVAAAGVQVRLSTNGGWYRFEQAGNSWELVAGPEGDPNDLLGADLPSY